MGAFNLSRKINFFNKFPWLWGCLHYIEGYEIISKKVITAEHLTILKVPKTPTKLWFNLEGIVYSGTGNCAFYAPLCVKDCHAEKNVLDLFNLDISKIFNLKKVNHSSTHFRRLKPYMVTAMCIATSLWKKKETDPYEWNEAEILLPPYRFGQKRNFSKICFSVGVK